MKVYYFGCWGAPGHYLWTPDGDTVGNERTATPWRSLDAVLCPGYVGSYKNGPQVEGEAALHHEGGWTALAFWDRSVDHRGGSNSGFYAEGTYGLAAMIEIAREHFPIIWARFGFEVRVVSRPSDVANPVHRCSVCRREGIGAVLDGWEHDPPGWFRRGDSTACSTACVTKSGARCSPAP